MTTTNNKQKRQLQRASSSWAWITHTLKLTNKPIRVCKVKYAQFLWHNERNSAVKETKCSKIHTYTMLCLQQQNCKPLKNYERRNCKVNVRHRFVVVFILIVSCYQRCDLVVLTVDKLCFMREHIKLFWLLCLNCCCAYFINYIFS